MFSDIRLHLLQLSGELLLEVFLLSILILKKKMLQIVFFGFSEGPLLLVCLFGDFL